MQRWNDGKPPRGAQILVNDCNGDGRNDLISSIDCHGLGLAWFEQQAGTEGAMKFVRHDIMDMSSLENDFGITFSQLHALAAKTMQVPDGFHVDLVAGEPYLKQPIAMCFDARGRIWVAIAPILPRPRALTTRDHDA